MPPYRPKPQIYNPGFLPTVDGNVTKIEDSVLSSSAAAFAALKLHDSFPPRPEYGKQGTSLTLWANYFALELPVKLVLYRYEWSVKEIKNVEKQKNRKQKSQELEGKKLGRVIELCLESPNLSKFRNDIVTDFRAILIAKRDIQDQDVTVTYRAEHEDKPRQGATQYTLALKKSKQLHASELLSYLKSTDMATQYDSRADTIQALNILINHHAKSTEAIATLGTSRSFCLDAETCDLGAGLTAVRGYFTSIRAATARVLLNANVSHAAFYKAGKLEDLMYDFGNRNPYELAFFLKKLRISATHLETKNGKGEIIPRVKTISSLAHPDDGYNNKGVQVLEHPPRVSKFAAGAKEVEFWLNETLEAKPSSSHKKKGGGSASVGGGYITVYDYFLAKHNHTVKNSQLAVVNIGTKEDPSYIPPGLCRVLPGQRTNNHLSAEQTSKMIKFAVRPPGDNATSIVSKALSTAGISNSKSSELGLFGVAVSRELIAVQGRLLREPKVLYAKKSVDPEGGSWNMLPRGGNKMQFAAGAVMAGQWSILFINMVNYPNPQEYTPNVMEDLAKKLEGILKETGIIIREQRAPLRVISLTSTEDPLLKKKIEAAANQMKLLFVVLPATQMPLYNRLKKFADVDYGIHTVCIAWSKYIKIQHPDQYLRNLALKVNLKFGGQNHHIQSDGLQLINENKTMIVGMDVTHPSPGSSSNAPSISAMVASVDSKLGQWPGTLRVQDNKREEMVSSLKDMLQSRLRLWRGINVPPTLPENILIYRDGVSEGQYSQVLETELPQLREACKELYPVPDQSKGLPRMTLVIVGKRHHTRFYVTKDKDAARSNNPKAGTVVDRGVTEARSWDFFLQSHHAVQGTARPAHYFVLLDEIFNRRYGKIPGKNVADQLQMTTQSLCYAFGRATKAVSYCTPAYLADILCERGRCYFYELYEAPCKAEEPKDAEAQASKEVGAPAWKEIKVHKNMVDKMFYI